MLRLVSAARDPQMLVRKMSKIVPAKPRRSILRQTKSLMDVGLKAILQLSNHYNQITEHKYVTTRGGLLKRTLSPATVRLLRRGQPSDAEWQL